MGTQNVWVSKIVGTQNYGYLVYGSSELCGGTQNFMFVCTNISGNSKFVGTCTQNLNFVGTQICGYSKFVGIQNLWMHEIYLYPKFEGLRFMGTPKIVGTQMFWYSYSKNY